MQYAAHNKIGGGGWEEERFRKDGEVETPRPGSSGGLFCHSDKEIGKMNLILCTRLGSLENLRNIGTIIRSAITRIK